MRPAKWECIDDIREQMNVKDDSERKRSAEKGKVGMA